MVYCLINHKKASNKLFKKLSLLSVYTVLLNFNISADMTSLTAHNEQPDTTKPTKYQWVNSSYVGYAWSTNTGISNPDTNTFRQVVAGDTDDAKLSSTSYAGIALSRFVKDWLAIGFAYEIYNSFSYQNIHVGSVVADPLASTSTEVFGDKFTRSFALVHQSALCSLYLNMPEKYKLTYGIFAIEPIIGGGLGVGINYMTGFQTVGLTATTPYTQVTTVGLASLKNSLAGFVHLGVGFKPKSTAATFGVGYRYYVGGNFSTGSQFVFYDATNGGDLVDAAPWTGTIKTNQLNVFLDFEF